MKVILTNQHCDNRGDESATIGHIQRIYDEFGQDTKIIMYKQTGKYQFIPSEYGIEERDMMITIPFMFQGMLWCMCKALKLDIRGILSKKMKEFITTHETADLILSSCGGPYIGDIYINHEIVHILYVLIPELLGKKVIFAAPSMGPFGNKLANPLRKYILRKSQLIVLRDKVSYDYVRKFLQQDHKIHLAADACFAHEIKEKQDITARKNMIGFTPLEYKYPKAENRDAEVEKYKQNIIRFFDELMEEDPELSVQFFPQLYNKHSDMALIEEFQRRMKYGDRTVVFPDSLSGPLQQKEIGNMKMMVATRYHSAVFSCKMHVPCICIAYEHKAFAMMDSFGLRDCTLDINTLTYDNLRKTYAYVQDNYEAIYERQVTKLPEVTTNAKKTMRLSKEVYKSECK